MVRLSNHRALPCADDIAPLQGIGYEILKIITGCLFFVPKGSDAN